MGIDDLDTENPIQNKPAARHSTIDLSGCGCFLIIVLVAILLFLSDKVFVGNIINIIHALRGQ
jgi:hypothetical protein